MRQLGALCTIAPLYRLVVQHPFESWWSLRIIYGDFTLRLSRYDAQVLTLAPLPYASSRADSIEHFATKLSLLSEPDTTGLCGLSSSSTNVRRYLRSGLLIDGEHETSPAKEAVGNRAVQAWAFQLSPRHDAYNGIQQQEASDAWLGDVRSPGHNVFQEKETRCKK